MENDHAAANDKHTATLAVDAVTNSYLDSSSTLRRDSLMIDTTKLNISTRATHSGTRPTEWSHNPIMPPLYMTTTFEVETPGARVQYDYSRSDNPTRTELQKMLANIESAKYSLAFSSGLGAMTTIAFLLRSGQQILSCDDVYGGTYRLFTNCLAQMNIETTYVDGTAIDNWTKNFIPGVTKLVWIETPTNPTMKIIDICKVVKALKQLDEKCIVCVDNTFITPLFQSPLELGADLVIHSCTKYIGGHSDIIMGAIMTNHKVLYDALKVLQNSLGICPSPFDCSQMMRSIRTLNIRVQQQAKNAQIIAEYLESNKYVDSVLYPGLSSHPQHELAKKQCTGFGAMLAFYLRSVTNDEPIKFVQSVKLFHCAESLGCVTSLIEIPALMTHAAVPKLQRQHLKITDNLLRVSVGIEDVYDLINDLDCAFEKVYGDTGRKE